jgi:hypothetical protein
MEPDDRSKKRITLESRESCWLRRKVYGQPYYLPALDVISERKHPKHHQSKSPPLLVNIIWVENNSGDFFSIKNDSQIFISKRAAIEYLFLRSLYFFRVNHGMPGTPNLEDVQFKKYITNITYKKHVTITSILDMLDIFVDRQAFYGLNMKISNEPFNFTVKRVPAIKCSFNSIYFQFRAGDWADSATLILKRYNETLYRQLTIMRNVIDTDSDETEPNDTNSTIMSASPDTADQHDSEPRASTSK